MGVVVFTAKQTSFDENLLLLLMWRSLIFSPPGWTVLLPRGKLYKPVDTWPQRNIPKKRQLDGVKVSDLRIDLFPLRLTQSNSDMEIIFTFFLQKTPPGG